jgi:chemosensory pili system protein ChpA (sensor histidine kinase/response regulator)
MSVQQRVEINSVETVLRELTPLIEEVQRTLEQGLEGDEPGAGTDAVARRLNEVRGTLQLLDLEGPSLLVDEMRVLALELSLGRVEAVEPGLEVLLKAVFKLPDYLDRLQAGRPDRPAVLLPLLNELRAARGAEALDERAVFRPRIESAVSAGAGQDDSGIRQTARRLRPRFQRALLGWYRNDDIEARLGELGSVLQDLAEATANPAAQRLWRVCGALTESLADQGLEADADVKRMMGRVERLLSQLVREGEAALERTIPLDLLRNLLYYVARSGSDSPRVREVKDAYHLEELLPDSEVQADFEGPNRALLEVVGEGIRDDLTSVRDAVEIYVHSDERRPDVLEGLPERLKQVADTFSMIGLQEDHDTLRAEADGLGDLDSLGAEQAEQRMQQLADVLLRVDSDLTELQRGRPMARGGSGDDDGLAIRVLPDSEYRPLLSAVVAASLEDLSRAREAIGAYCGDPEAGQEAVAEVPALLAEVGGAMAVLPLEQVVSLVRGLRRYIEREFVERGSRPEEATQVLLADVVAGIEYYLEAVDHDRAGMTHLLEGASRAMAALESGGSPQTHDEDEEVVISSADGPGSVAPETGAGESAEDAGAWAGGHWGEIDFESDSQDWPAVAGADDSEAASDPEATSDGRGGQAGVAPADFDLGEAAPGHAEPATGERDSRADALELEARFGDPGHAPDPEATIEGRLGPDEPGDLARGRETPGEAPEAGRGVDSASGPEGATGDTGGEPSAPDVPGGAETQGDDDATVAGGADLSDLDLGDLELDDRADTAGADASTQSSALQADDEEDPEATIASGQALDDFPWEELEAAAGDEEGAGTGAGAGEKGSETATAETGAPEEGPDATVASSLDLEALEDREPQAAQPEPAGSRDTGPGLTPDEDEDDTVAAGGADFASAQLEASDADDATLAGDEADAQRPGVDPAASGSQYAIVGEDVDDEIVDVFIEEALGELDKINENLPAWKADTNNDEALVIVRRAFHTLKGGGRLIGAELIGEFSWSMENMLNRVIDHSIEASGAVFDTLDEASAALPQLIEQIRGNQAPIEGIDDLIARAHALSRGQDPPPGGGTTGAPGGGSPDESGRQGAGAADSGTSGRRAAGTGGERAAGAPEAATEADPGARTEQAAQPESAPASAAAAEADGDAPVPSDAVDERPHRDAGADAMSRIRADDAGGAGQDPLLEIFGREAQTHLTVLSETFESDAARAGESLPVSEDVRRALHTLVGSAQTAGCDEIAEMAGQMEAIVKARREADARLDATEVALFRETLDALARMVAALGPEQPEIDPGDIPERLEARRQEVVSEAHAAQEEGESELLDIFLEEADELLEACDRGLARWREHPDDREVVADLQRNLHTLKGGARMASFMPIADLTHEVESVVNAVDSGERSLDEDVFELLQEALDALTVLLEQARGRQAVTRVDWLVEDLRQLHAETEGSGADPAPSEAAPSEAAPSEAAPSEAAPSEADRSVAHPSGGGDAAAGSGDSGGSAAAAPAQSPVESRASEDAADPSVAREEPAAREAAPASSEGKGSGDRAPAPEAAPVQAQPGSDQIRVQSELLDNLVNFAGEVSIYHSRLGEQMGQYRFNLNEFEQTVSRLRDQLRAMENETESQILHRHEKEQQDQPRREDFDPLEFDRYTRIQELSRSLAESVGDLDSIKEILENLTRDAETLLLQQSRVSSELQDGLMQTRMVRFDGLRARLSRTVRQTASQVGKKAQLTMSGGELEVDRSIQERIVAPLEHILRNAVSHGIETAEERREAGKPEQGSIRLDLHRGGTDMIIEISDDGRGIDPDAVRRKGIERGLIDADDELDDNEVIKLILETGFSTAGEVTQIAGRGVGMDVVDAEVRRLGGTLGIHTRKGAGTRFIVRLPVTLAINQAVLVQAGDDTYAIPIASIEGVTQVTAGDLKQYYVDPSRRLTYAENEYRVQHLGSLLGIAEPRLDNPEVSYPVIMIRAGDDRVALHVDQLLGRREVVVKPVGAPVNMLPGISGATIMADGTVVLILDLGGLLRTEGRFVATGEAAAEDAAADTDQGVEAGTHTPTVLVVDDSITIRKVTQRILARNGINVATAKDGVDALSWMAQTVPDLILLDIEMPRMDGYEVAGYVKSEARLRDVPIIMITSRTGEKHRQRAEDIGVDHYLGKPYQEVELMEHIGSLIRLPAAA